MPLTVITLRNSTPSLRGDLSKWMQEIATGVYVGNFNSRIREKLWQRVKDSVGAGEATLSYASRNEIGYLFETYNTMRSVIDSDGIPLVMLPKEKRAGEEGLKYGFSNVAKFQKSKHFKKVSPKTSTNKSYVVLDIETSGLDSRRNVIIEIGALKIVETEIEEFHSLIKCDEPLPQKIIEITGITDSLLHEEGILIEEALNKLVAFIANEIIVGYNIRFDIEFINTALRKTGKTILTNKTIDILSLVKKENMFLDSYRLEKVLKAYQLDVNVPHRALDDARLIYQLSQKVNKFIELLN